MPRMRDGNRPMPKLREVLRDSVYGYLIDADDDHKLLYFNKLVAICTSNATRLFIPSRTVGFGLYKEKTLKDHLVKDLAEEFVLERLGGWLAESVVNVKTAIDSGKFDYLPHRFKQRVLNKIRDINRSHEEDWVETLSEEDGGDPYESSE